jgi:hypothetical protein
MKYLVFIQKTPNKISEHILNGSLKEFLKELDDESNQNILTPIYSYETAWATDTDEPDWHNENYDKIIFKMDLYKVIRELIRIADNNDLPHIEIDNCNSCFNKDSEIALLIGPFKNDQIITIMSEKEFFDQIFKDEVK